MDLLAANVYFRYPFSLALFVKNATETGCAVAGRLCPGVLHILRSADISQIVDAIVQRITINVIYFVRPHAIHVKPRKSVSEMRLTINGYYKPFVTGSVGVPYASSNIARSIVLRSSNASRENAGIGVVMKNYFKALLGQRTIALAHLSFLTNDESGSDAAWVDARQRCAILS